jgi:DNA-binding GntR family transcriptional regulator
MDPKLSQSIAREIEDDIRRGALPPGAILHQEALAERFGVSRQPIRLAVEALRAAGLVVARRDRRVEIAAPGAQALRDLLAVRRLVEREALALALPRQTPRDLLMARQLQERLEIETDPKMIEELDCAFHTALCRPCGNARLLGLIETLRREDRRPYVEQPPGSPERARWRDEHGALLAACAAGDGEAAQAALDRHFASLQRDDDRGAA